MLVGNGLPIHGNDVSIQQPRRDNLYPQLGGEPLENLPNGGSFDRDPLGGPPLDAHVRFYGWPTLDPRMFMPPWYPPVAI